MKLPHDSCGTIAAAYGIERLNKEVSTWMRGLSESDDHQQLPFIATRGYDSVVWNRLYSQDLGELEDYEIDQVREITFHGSFYSFIFLLRFHNQLG